MSETTTPAPDAPPPPPPDPTPEPAPPETPPAPAPEAAAPAPPPWTGPTFEYQYLGISMADQGALIDQLNAEGAQGWEAVSAEMLGGHFRILLMRETPA